MLNDSQRAVMKGIAENKATFECLKEYFQEKFNIRTDPGGLTDQELGSFARAQYEGLKRVEEAFREIASCKNVEVKNDSVNPAR